MGNIGTRGLYKTGVQRF